MSELFWLGVAISLLVAWSAGVYLLNRRGLLEPRHLHAAGPFLMWKTGKGRDLIDRIARRKRLWSFFGDASLVIVALTMLATTLLLVWEATIVQSPAVRQNAPSPQLLLGLPGINPLIPLWYGIFGLTIAIVLHEFAHGILSRVSNVRIRSLGVIFFLVPIGAFVEPDEDEMKALPRRERARLYAVGPATNMVLAVLFAVLFSSLMASSIVPAHAGIGIAALSAPDSPAAVAGLRPFTIITSFNDTEIASAENFTAARALVRVNQTVNVTTYDPATGTFANYSVTLGQDPNTGDPLLGIYGFDVRTDFFYPLGNPDRFGGIPNAVLVYISLPFSGRAPIQEPFYEVRGAWAAVPEPLFYLLANSLYWLFWLNVMLGATNALPAVPLDGGFIFKDALEEFVSRLRRGIGAEARDRIVKRVSYLFALFILALIVWQFIGPRV
ncbi:MAG TPA: site-2 protease family protein [Thermoplasmata archaeon]|jgi:membrane-associated protease RseP (regulator of RpoE activity)|nr:site-2 protease family protein [Thermoplasmata archaeon]